MAAQNDTRNQKYYKAPDVPQAKITPYLVRDELLLCFESANRDFAALLEQPVTDEGLHKQVKQFVTGVFDICSASFDSPTKAGIVSAIGQCKQNAETMMGPKGTEIINHHYEEIMKLVNRLPA